MRSKTSITKCGTCQYWTGCREPVFDKNGEPKVDIVDDLGVCENVNSRRFYRQMRDQRRSCMHFSKWTEIL